MEKFYNDSDLKKVQVYTLGEAVTKKSNNLQLIKFLAAIFVIICHAFALTGNDEKDWMDILTMGQMDFGMLAVSIFFLTSGLLIAKSMEGAKTFSKFFKLRCVRIFPPLVIVVVLSVFAGAFLTELSMEGYFINKHTWSYLLNSVFILQHSLPGVFEHNIYGNTVNGALWTLPIEFLCYVACFVVYKMNGLRKKRIFFFMAVYLCGAVVGNIVLNTLNLSLVIAAIQPCWLFLLGMFMYTYKNEIVLDYHIFIIAFILMIASFALSLTYLAIWIWMPYVIIYLAFMKNQCVDIIAKLGNYSYTIYLCAFPIQQTIISINGGVMNPIINIFISMFIAIVVGMILYYAGEKPITRLLLYGKD